MRVNREKAAENRERIVEAAARLFREHGFDGVGVDAIMKEAGLTHGGFYGHFASNEELATEAITRAFAQGSEKLGHCSDLGGLVNAYLSDAHCADRSEGCALAALSADIAREGKGVRHALQRLARIAGFFKGAETSGRKRAIATLSGLVGALTLARAVDDPALRKEILVAARGTFGA